MVWRNPPRGGEYLYRLTRNGTPGSRKERSLGPRSAETERLFDDFHRGREQAMQSVRSLSDRLEQQARLNRALDLGRVPDPTSRILRRLHAENLLGGTLVVAGTNALYAYEAAAGVHIGSDLLATGDLDILFDARAKLKLSFAREPPQRIMDILTAVDRSFRRQKQPHQAVNDSGFFVDLIKPTPRPPWRPEREEIGTGDLTAVMIDNLRWMESAPKFEAVAIGTDGAPVPMACADPRAFALYKLNMGKHDRTRDPVKRQRDVLQAEVVAQLVRDTLPQLRFTPEQLRSFPLHVVAREREALDPFFSGLP